VGLILVYCHSTFAPCIEWFFYHWEWLDWLDPLEHALHHPVSGCVRHLNLRGCLQDELMATTEAKLSAWSASCHEMQTQHATAFNSI